MRQENDEEKKVKYDRLDTWDLLDEVNDLVKHVPNWKKFDFNVDVQLLYKLGYDTKKEKKR
jgi:hypothetical protein